MVIVLYTEEIVKQLRTISHREVAAIEDPEARYRAEAGSEKLPEIYRCVWEAFARLSARCSRWLKATYEHKRDNVYDVPSEFGFEFVLSERRSINSTEPLLNDMHNFMVEYALSKFYSMVNQGELSNKHSLLAIDAGNNIDQTLYIKQPPRV